MKLLIEIRNGQPHQHPILESNFKQAFPNIDVNNLPSNFAYFERVAPPVCGPYEVLLDNTYVWDNGIVKDSWNVRQMTQQEKLLKQQRVKQQWAEQDGYASWLFDEATCSFTPPIPFPYDGKHYLWNEALTNWEPVLTG